MRKPLPPMPVNPEPVFKCVSCGQQMGVIYGRFREGNACSRECNDAYEALLKQKYMERG